MYFSLLLGTMRPSKPSAHTRKAHNQGSDENVYSLENLFKEGRPSATLTGNIVQYKVSYWVALLPFLPSFNFITRRVPWALLTVAGLSAESVSVVKDTATTFVNVRQVTSEHSVCYNTAILGGWRDGSVVKSIACYSKGPEFNSQQPQPWWLTTICNEIGYLLEEDTWSVILINLDHETQYEQVQQNRHIWASHVSFSNARA